MTKDNKINKIKVSKLAKELDLTSKDLISALKDLGVAVKTAASSIDEESANIVREVIKPKQAVEGVAGPSETIPEEEIQPAQLAEEKVAEPKGPVIDTEDVSVKELADKINVKSSDVIKELMKKGIMATINQRIHLDIAKEIVAALGRQVTVKIHKAGKKVLAKVNQKNLVPRPPVVTVMGHVDHGKTKLLDAIRKTRVAEGEAGGITQHIGAYQVEVQNKKVTFLDTPGHEAFTALRARGAKATDIAVLVVAADDGVKPQTVEAIDHAKAAGVPIIVAINKIDRSEGNLDRVKQQLSKQDLVAEDWGGKIIMVPTSATEGTGINELLEMILLLAEIQELKADPGGIPSGVVLESRLDKGRGPVASLLVKNGTLRVGDVFSLGETFGKVRALFSDTGSRLKEAGPAMPVEVLGCSEVPTAGDILEVLPSERDARELAERRKENKRKVAKGKVLSLEDFSRHIEEGEKQDLVLVVKADVQGSLNAISHSIEDFAVGNIRINIIHEAVGPITESDIMLARASGAIVIGFNVGFEGNAEAVSLREGIGVRRYNIIYKLIDDIKLAMEGMLKPEYEEVVIGHAEVRTLFKFSKVGIIAGSFVKDGKMLRGAGMRIIRDEEKIYEGKIDSLKRFKNDVKMVEQSFECGVAIPGYTNFRVGDVIEAFEIREKPRIK